MSEAENLEKQAELAHKRKVLYRQRNQSAISKDDSHHFKDLSPSSGRRRRRETESMCQVIHGSTDDNITPLLDGLWVTLINRVSAERLENYLSASKKVTQRILPKLIKQSVKEFEKSDADMERSCKVLYSNGLISKEKYK